MNADLDFLGGQESLENLRSNNISLEGQYPGTSIYSGIIKIGEDAKTIDIQVFNAKADFVNALQWSRMLSVKNENSQGYLLKIPSIYKKHFERLYVPEILDTIKLSGDQWAIVYNRTDATSLSDLLNKNKTLDDSTVKLLAQFAHYMESMSLPFISPRFLSSMGKRLDPFFYRNQRFIENGNLFAQSAVRSLNYLQQLDVGLVRSSNELIYNLQQSMNRINIPPFFSTGLHGRTILSQFRRGDDSLEVLNWKATTSHYWVPFYQTASMVSYFLCWPSKMGSIDIAGKLYSYKRDALNDRHRKMFDSIFIPIVSQRMLGDFSDIALSSIENQGKTSDGFEIDLERVVGNIYAFLKQVEVEG